MNISPDTHLQKILDDQSSDSELLKMAEIELKELEIQFEKNEKKLKFFLLPKDEADKKNAINSEMLKELMGCTNYANENDSVRAVVYKSTGDVFCAGLDLYDFKENNMTNALSDVFNLLHKPKLAVLEGDAYGGGVLLILCCNYVISKSDVKLCLPEVDRGLFPFQVMDALIKVMPAKKALDWCIRGLSVDAKDCLKMNVIDEINNNISFRS